MIDENSVSKNLLGNKKGDSVKLQIVPLTPKTLSHLPKRPSVDLAFHNLSYRVKEGRKSSK